MILCEEKTKSHLLEKLSSLLQLSNLIHVYTNSKRLYIFGLFLSETLGTMAHFKIWISAKTANRI